jgi:amidase
MVAFPVDAVAQAALVRTGARSPRDLVEEAIANIERLDPALNAVIHTRFARARQEADDPSVLKTRFCGVPILLKDALCHSAGDRFHMGLQALRDLDWRAETDTHLVQAMRAAGFIIVGRTNTPELAGSMTTEPRAYGPTLNPWDTDRSAGGSSGGSAAAVAAGMVSIGHGNDMGGSIRIPASACGVVGLKPSRGRTSLGPNLGEHWSGLTHEGVLTRTVRDTAAVLDAIARPWPGDPYQAPPPARPLVDELRSAASPLRIGLCTNVPNPGGATDPACVYAAELTARVLQEAGHQVEESAPVALGAPGARRVHARLVAMGAARDLARLGDAVGRAIDPSKLEPINRRRVEYARRRSALEHLGDVEAMQAHARVLAQWWTTGFDVLLTPTLPHLPPRIGELGPDAGQEAVALTGEYVAFVYPWNMTGQPAISLPIHCSEGGLPVGVQLVAAYGREDMLIRLAAALEEALPWAGRRPPVS